MKAHEKLEEVDEGEDISKEEEGKDEGAAWDGCIEVSFKRLLRWDTEAALSIQLAAPVAGLIFLLGNNLFTLKTSNPMAESSRNRFMYLK